MKTPYHREMVFISAFLASPYILLHLRHRLCCQFSWVSSLTFGLLFLYSGHPLIQLITNSFHLQLLNTADPWTTLGVGVLTLHAIKNLHIIYIPCSVSRFFCIHILHPWIRSTLDHVVPWHLLLKKPHKSGTMQFKPMLYKGQLYMSKLSLSLLLTAEILIQATVSSLLNNCTILTIEGFLPSIHPSFKFISFLTLLSE